jgi:hypothetical protein
LTFGVLAAVAASSSSTDNITPGVLGFLVVAAMGVALVFLLHKITPPPGSDADNDAKDPKAPAGTPK